VKVIFAMNLCFLLLLFAFTLVVVHGEVDSVLKNALYGKREFESIARSLPVVTDKITDNPYQTMLEIATLL
jgi:hypothetical protein